MAVTQNVVPDNGVAEGRYVAVAILAIVGLAALLLPHHQAGSVRSSLAPHQITHVDLPASLVEPFINLKLAHEEIRDWHRDNLDAGLTGSAAWPDIQHLTDSHLPPFTRGQWQRPASGHYLGRLEDRVLLLDSTRAAPRLWLCDITPGQFDADTLTHTGCQQMVAPGAHSDKEY